MKIITGFNNRLTPEWDKYISNLKWSAERFGHEVYSIDFPTNDEWLANNRMIYLTVSWKYKIEAILSALKHFQGENLLWIDADCIVMSHIEIDEVLNDCDLAFTLRDIQDRGMSRDPRRDGYLNTGVIFVKNNQRSIDFLNECNRRVLLTIYDQEAVNNIILERSKMEKHGEIIKIMDANVKILNCRDYNFFYFGEDHGRAKVVHFKGEHREKYFDFFRKEITNKCYSHQ